MRPFTFFTKFIFALCLLCATSLIVIHNVNADKKNIKGEEEIKASFDNLTTLSNRVIKLSTRYDYPVSDIQSVQTYQLKSSTDPHFSSPTRPTKIGRSQKLTDLGGDWSHIKKDVSRTVYLIFSHPLKTKQSYTLTIQNNSNKQTFTFTYSETDSVNGSVKINHVGYLPTGPKYGYVGNYLGSAGMMDISASPFEIRNAKTHQPVFTSTSTFRGDDLQLSGEKVFECDFSSLDQPGTYYLYVPGIGKSHTFEIGDSVFNSVFYTSARGLFYQRCGMALQPPYADARWKHEACHLQDGIIHESHPSSPLYNNEPINDKISLTGGWHDAGDYGKYVPTAAVSLFYLFTAYELYPERFPDDKFDIPESGNGVPDILDEAKWEIDWLKNMQAPDGGVYFKLTTKAWPTTMPENDRATRYLSPKTTYSTGQYAAVMAMAYRSFLPFWPAYAQTCLAHAKKAWDFLEKNPNPLPTKGFKNPKGIGGGEYGDPAGDADERAWAAAELYKSTGHNKYEKAFITHWKQHKPMWGWNTFQHHQQRASWAYATTTFPTRDVLIDIYKEEFGRSLSDHLKRTKNNVYRNGYRSDVPEWIGWGSYAQSTQYAWQLILARYLFNNTAYLNEAKINLDPILGNNPQSISYISGIGKKYPLDPLHHPSMHDGETEPVPGLPVFGPHSQLSSGNPFFVVAKETLFPAGQSKNDPYPLLRRYMDINELVPMSEFTIQEMALNTSVFAFFSSHQANITAKNKSK